MNQEEPRIILPGDPDFTTEAPAPILRRHVTGPEDDDAFDTFAGLGVRGLK